MAKSVASYTWERGFREPTNDLPWEVRSDPNDNDGYVCPPSKEVATSTHHNDFGVNVLRTWPTIYDGTNSPHGTPNWWQPKKEVDVLICGAGPSGLEVALSLARQGVSFRIVGTPINLNDVSRNLRILDKQDSPLIAGRADGVQPRFLETLASWGLAKEVHEEGPLIERTAIYKDGKKLFFNHSHQSDSRYRGLHIITQGQIERIYVRDLMRHKILVERNTTLSDFAVDRGGQYPVAATLLNTSTGQKEDIRAQFLIGSDGAASQVRKKVQIPFDGMSTDIYWGIIDCIFESDYPHAWVFGSVISSKHGGCVIIPREDGYIRLYTQLDVSQTGPLARSRLAKDPTFAESGGNIDAHSITAEEVLEQANRIFAPYTVKFAAPISWFSVWKISERVARSFSSPDQRVHLTGDAAHIHSVMGAFGLNASIIDAANLAWKVGLVARNKAKLDVLMPTYNHERRDHAVDIIETSGEYLRFVCTTSLGVVKLRSLGLDFAATAAKGIDLTSDSNSNSINGVNGHPPQGEVHETATTSVKGNADSGDGREKDLKFLDKFFKEKGQFLLGLDAPYEPSAISPPSKYNHSEAHHPPPVKVRNAVRAPNPRVCFSTNETGYLYDKMIGGGTIHVVVFASTLHGKVLRNLQLFSDIALGSSSFYHRFGGSTTFNIVVVAQCLPFELDRFLIGTGLNALQKEATFVFDDRPPDETAHTTWGANHERGAVVVVRPDLWVGNSCFLDDFAGLDGYFASFLLPSKVAS
ncbi:MAG: hypothetical protein M1821_009640 [Bathelium mastoideum]|nr:MAG: hypothetical protein M1821_009640 [Bathelium mastoideum]